MSSTFAKNKAARDLRPRQALPICAFASANSYAIHGFGSACVRTLAILNQLYLTAARRQVSLGQYITTGYSAQSSELSEFELSNPQVCGSKQYVTH